MKPKFFLSAREFRSWLDKNHDQVQELSIEFRKKRSREPRITYREALDEALCYGWIDGVRKKVDERSYTIRFSPRRATSSWSAINIRRATELTKLGQMTAPGTRAFQERVQRKEKYSYENKPRKLESRLKRSSTKTPMPGNFFSSKQTGIGERPPSGY